MMYTMPKNLLSICVNFTLATQRVVAKFGLVTCEADGICADTAREQHKASCPSGKRAFPVG